VCMTLEVVSISALLLPSGLIHHKTQSLLKLFLKQRLNITVAFVKQSVNLITALVFG